MTATAEIRVHHGAAPGLGTDVTGATLRLKLSDEDVQNAGFPVPVPTSGLEYSWRKSLRLVFTAPPDNEISNLRWYSNGGSPGTGRRVLYATPGSYTEASAADESTPISAADASLVLVGSPVVLEPGVLCDYTDTFPLAAGAAGAQPYLELQLEVGPTALAGTGGSMAFSYRYNET